MLHWFFVKQKTAYEMRSSDWSSDVCSSDLTAIEHGIQLGLRNAEFIERCIAGIRWKLEADRQRLAVKAAEPCADPVATIVRDDAAITRGDGLDTAGGGRNQGGVVILGAGCEHGRSEEHTSELQSLMRISYAVFC